MCCHPSCSHTLASLGPSWGHLGSNFASSSLRLGPILPPAWLLLGLMPARSWPRLAPPYPLTWHHLGRSWPHLAPTSPPSWPHFGPLGAEIMRKGYLLLHLLPPLCFPPPGLEVRSSWASVGHLASILGPYWLHFGSIVALTWPILGHLGSNSRPFLGPLLGPFELHVRTIRSCHEPSLRASGPSLGLASFSHSPPNLDTKSQPGASAGGREAHTIIATGVDRTATPAY